MKQLVNLMIIDLRRNYFNTHTLDQIKALFPTNCRILFDPQQKKDF